MLKNIFLSTVVSIICSLAIAGPDELDRNPVNQAIQGTVVLRMDQRDGAISMVQLDEVIATESQAQQIVTNEFQVVPQDKVRSELDREAGASSWYWYYPGYSYGYNNAYYYYYGNCYNPWYTYSYGYYSYYYYNRYSYYW
jgi:hypothetical protein